VLERFAVAADYVVARRKILQDARLALV
jgi:hypothetical protein